MSETITREIECPLTGEIVGEQDIDGLMAMRGVLLPMRDRINDALRDIAFAIAKQSSGAPNCRTRRVVGKTMTIKVEMPAPIWDSARLQEAWNAYPQFRTGYLRVARIDPVLREVNKLRATTNAETPEAFEQFKAMVLGAEKESTATPKITIEKQQIDVSDLF